MTDTYLSNAFFDDGIITFLDNNKKKCHNVFEIALQAMIGKDVILPYEKGYQGLKPRYYDIKKLSNTPDTFSKKAIEYLEDHIVNTGKDMITWHYDYDVIFRGEKVLESSWSSAFGHAYAVLAFVYWYRISGKEKYLKYALNGANFFTVKISNGGFVNDIKYANSSYLFFEELPISNPTHILNAHLISMVALTEVYNISKQTWLKDLLDKSLETLDILLPLYDTGSWSRYDIPNELRALFRISMDKIDALLFSKIWFQSQSGILEIEISDENFNDKKQLFLSGIDWGAEDEIDGYRVRKALNGKLLRSTAVPTGTIQNTYLNCVFKDFNKMLINDKHILFGASFYAENNGFFLLENQKSIVSSQFNFLSLHSIAFSKGWNHVILPIEINTLSYPLHVDYHLFHTKLIKILSSFFKSRVLIESYSKYTNYLQSEKEIHG